MKEVVLKAEHMYKDFGPTKAVTDMTLELKRGVVTGLVGENGSEMCIRDSIWPWIPESWDIMKP